MARETPNGTKQPRSMWRRPWVIVLVSVLAVVVFAVVLVVFVLGWRTYVVPSASMEPTIQRGDRIIVDQNAFDGGHVPERRDIVVYARPDSLGRVPQGDPCDMDEQYVARVIGLPGELLAIEGGNVSIDYEFLEEPYAEKDVSEILPVPIPEGHVFVMGDNRANSSDSRSLLGPLPLEMLCGRVVEILEV